MNTVQIRLAVAEDIDSINIIYNHYVLHSTCTYQTQPSTSAEHSQWFTSHGPRHPVTVALLDGNVAGWGSLSPFHQRAAFSRTVENSVYVDHQHHRRGIGMAILRDLIQRARTLEHHAIIAGIDAEQIASVKLHERAGFQPVGHLRQVGHKFGRWLDVIYMQLMV